MTTPLAGIIAAHVAAVNAFDTESIVATFASDAFVNDNRREFWGAEAIAKWFAKELVGDRITMEVTDVIEHGATTVVRAKYDGNYDKSKLPPVLILTSYFNVADEKIQSLVIIHNA